MSAKRARKSDKDESEIIDDTVSDPEKGEATLQECIQRALDAARMADDAAEDIDAMRISNEAVIKAMEVSQKRTSYLAIGAAVGAVVATALSGLVYFRSVEDLREAGLIQAETMKALAEQTLALQDVVTAAGEDNKALADKLDTFQSTMMDDLNALVSESASMQPQIASAIQTHTEESILALKDELIAVVNDLDMSLTQVMAENIAKAPSGEGLSPELIQILSEIKSQLAARPTQTAASASTTRRANTSSSRPASRPAAEPNPFTFP